MEDIVIVIPIINKPVLTDEMLIEQLMHQMQVLVEVGAIKGDLDEIIHDYVLRKETGYIDVYIPKDALVWADKLETVGAGMSTFYFPVEYLNQNPEKFVEHTEEGDKFFSLASINDRLRIAKYNPKMRFRMTMLDYKRFWKAKEKSLVKNPDLLIKFRNMFLTDVMGMFTEVLPFIEEGKQLSTLVGTSQITPQLNQVARDLSIAYRRAMRVEKNTGQLSKNVYSKLKESYTKFMTILMDSIFPGMSEIIGGDNKPEMTADKVVEQVEESKNYSYTSDGRIKLFS